MSWKTKIGDVVDSEIGPEEIHTLKGAVRTKYGIFVRDVAKNSLFIGYLMAEAWEQGKRSPTLEKLCRGIIDYAKSLQAVDGTVAVAAVDQPLREEPATA